MEYIAIILIVLSIIGNIVQLIVLRKATTNAIIEIDKNKEINSYLESFIDELVAPLDAIKNSSILSEDPLVKELYKSVTSVRKKIYEYKSGDENNDNI